MNGCDCVGLGIVDYARDIRASEPDSVIGCGVSEKNESHCLTMIKRATIVSL